MNRPDDAKKTKSNRRTSVERIALALGITLPLLTLLAWFVMSQGAAQIRVSATGADGRTLTEALQIARPGDEILLAAGEYRSGEMLTVPEGVTLTGSTGAVVLADLRIHDSTDTDLPTVIAGLELAGVVIADPKVRLDLSKTNLGQATPVRMGSEGVNEGDTKQMALVRRTPDGSAQVLMQAPLSSGFDIQIAGGVDNELEMVSPRVADNGKKLLGLRDETGEIRVYGSTAPLALNSEAVSLSAVFSTTLYVDASTGNDFDPTHDGTSWATAFATLQKALDTAEPMGQAVGIYVAEGVYIPTRKRDADDPRSASFTMLPSVHLFGGFIGGIGGEATYLDRVPNAADGGYFNAPGQHTILDGQYLVNNVVMGSGDATIDGFTIVRGYAQGGNFPAGRGAGIANLVASPVVRNCIFLGNEADNYGGAMYNFLASPRVEHCRFANNSALARGGAVYNESNSEPTFTDCEFIGNQLHGQDGATGGGAVGNWRSSPSFIDCRFHGNVARNGTNGGAVSNVDTNSNNDNNPTFINCVFIGNRATPERRFPVLGDNNITRLVEGLGGAVYNLNSSPLFENCRFGGKDFADRNTTLRHGGAVFNDYQSEPHFNNCIFENSLAGLRGGAMYNRDTSPTISNCTFRNNSAPYGGAIYSEQASVVVGNSTFTQNRARESQILDYSGTPYYPGVGYYLDGDYFAGGGGLGSTFFPPMPVNPPPGPAPFPKLVRYFGGQGGAIYNDDTRIQIRDCTFVNNRAVRFGGAIFNGRGQITFDPNDTVDEVPGSGTGQVGADATIYNSVFRRNSALERGGAIYTVEGSSCTVDGSAFGELESLEDEANIAGVQNPTEVRPERDVWEGVSSFTNGADLVFRSVADFTLPTGFRDHRLVVVPPEYEETTVTVDFVPDNGEYFIIYAHIANPEDPEDPNGIIVRVVVWLDVNGPNEPPDVGSATYIAVEITDDGTMTLEEYAGAIAAAINANDEFRAYRDGTTVIIRNTDAFGNPIDSNGAGTAPNMTIVTTNQGRRGPWLYLVGGVMIDDYTGVPVLSNLVFRTDMYRGFGSASWQSVNDLNTKRAGFAVAYVDRDLWVLGGYTAIDPNNGILSGETALVERLVIDDLPGGLWGYSTSLAAPRADCNGAVAWSAALDRAVIYIAGSTAGSLLTDIWQYDQTTGATDISGSFGEVANDGYAGITGPRNWSNSLNLPDYGSDAGISALSVTLPNSYTRELPFVYARVWRVNDETLDSKRYAIAGMNTAEPMRRQISPPGGTHTYPGKGWRNLHGDGYLNRIYVGGGLDPVADCEGGAIANDKGTLIVKNSVFYENRVGPASDTFGEPRGGAIHSTGGSVEIVGANFDGNTAIANGYDDSRGGAVSLDGATAIVRNTTVINNFSDLNGPQRRDLKSTNSVGGGLYATGANLTIRGSYFGENEAIDSFGGTAWPFLRGGAVGIAGGTSVIEATTIKNNVAGGYVDPFGEITYGTGGGMQVDGGSLEIKRSRFDGNVALDGGALYSLAASATISNSVFVNNQAYDWGGAIYDNSGYQVGITLTRCTLENNIAVWGGAVDSFMGNVSIEECTLRGNQAWLYGGGIFGYGSMYDSIIIGNTAAISGGGVEWASPHPDIIRLEEELLEKPRRGAATNLRLPTTTERTKLLMNSAEYGGGVYDNSVSVDSSFINSIIWGNDAYVGGGCYTYSSERIDPEGEDAVTFRPGPQFIHTSFSNNLARLAGGAIFHDLSDVVLVNSILWGNVAQPVGQPEVPSLGEIVSDNSVARVSYSCVRGGREGVGNIGADLSDDPLFIDPSTGNLRIQAASPCVNTGATAADLQAAGINDVMLPVDDIGRYARIDGMPDMGAYESRGEGPRMRVSGRDVVIFNGDSTPEVGDDTDFGFIDPNGHYSGTLEYADDAYVDLEAGASDEYGAYEGLILRVTDGTLVDERTVLSYDGINRRAFLSGEWSAQIAEDIVANWSAYTYELLAIHTFTILNNGVQDLILTGTPRVQLLTGNLPSSDFVVESQPSSPLASGASSTFRVSFRPLVDDVNLRVATVRIENTDLDQDPYVFAIQGNTGVPLPDITVTGNDQDIPDGSTDSKVEDGTYFGILNKNGGSATHTFRVVNSGTDVLDMDPDLAGAPFVGFDPASNADGFFSVTRDLTTSTLDPGESTYFEITYTPTAVGAHSAKVMIRNNTSSKDPYDFVIAGSSSGPQIQVTGNSVLIDNGATEPSAANNTDFGVANAENDYEVTKWFTIKNTGTVQLKLDSIPRVAVVGTDPNDFVVTNQPADVIPPGWSTNFSVRFGPTDAGIRRATIEISNTDQSFEFAVQGENGALGNIPPVAVTSVTVNGDATNEASNIGSNIVTLSGSGSYDLDGWIVDYRWEEALGNPAPVGVDGTSGATYAAIHPSFDSNGLPSGIYTFTLEVEDNEGATDSEDIVVYIGTVAVLTLPESVREDAGTVQASVRLTGGALGPETVSLSASLDSSGVARISVPDAVVILEDETSATFTITVIDNDTPADSDTVTVTATPATPGYAGSSADLYIVDDDAAQIDVKGNGITIVNGSTTPSDANHTIFSTVSTSGGYSTRTYTISNLGKAQLDILSATIENDVSNAFLVELAPASELDGGTSTSFRVRFEPTETTLGVLTAQVRIASSGDPRPGQNVYTFAIQGTKVLSAEMNVQGNSINIVNGSTTPALANHTDFGSVNVDGETVTRTFTIQNQGGENLILNGDPDLIQILGTHAVNFSVTANPSTPIAGGGSTTFAITFDPSGSGVRQAQVVIPNNDRTKNPYTFAIQGTGFVTEPPPPDGDDDGDGDGGGDGDGDDGGGDGDGFVPRRRSSGGCEMMSGTATLAGGMGQLVPWLSILLMALAGTMGLRFRNRRSE